jgi:hypothetical protein
MRNRLLLLGSTACFCGLVAVPASAQTTVSAQPPALSWDLAPADASLSQAPPNLAYIEGAVDVVQDGMTGRADPPQMLLEGDVVRTRIGRAEIVFGDGTLLHLSNDSELGILSHGYLRLVTGRAIVRVSHSSARAYVFDTTASTVRLAAPGEYSVTADRMERLEVAATRGSATIDEPSPWTINGGQKLTLAGSGARPLIESFNSARWDAFDVWSYDRANAVASSASSTQLPYELRSYGSTLDSYGQWGYMAPYGYVWYPSVSVDWRPYHDGSWSYTQYGWTWYGHDRWAWPTHHYGRWGFKGNSWYWIPDRIWGPGWVSWSVAAGFVGWAPLGMDYHPAVGLYPTIDHLAYWSNDGPGRAWTFIPREHFLPRHRVTPHAVGFDRIDDSARRALADAVVTPPVNNVAVPRGSVVTGRVPGNVRRPPRSDPSGGTTMPAAPQPPASFARDRDATLPGRTVVPRRDFSPRTGNDPAFAPRSWDVVGTPTPRAVERGTPAEADSTTGPAGAPRDPQRAYAPRRTREGDRPRGGARDPGVRPAPRDDGGQAPAATPRTGARGGTPQRGSASGAPSSPSGSGAVERGRPPAPRAGAPSGRSGGAASSGPAPAGQAPARGAARRP